MKILSLVKNIPSNIENFFKEASVEVVTGHQDEFRYILVDTTTDLMNISSKYLNKGIISINEEVNRELLIENNGVLLLCESVLLSSFGLFFYKRFFMESPSLHVTESLSNKYKDHFKHQVNSLFVTGSYFDEVYKYFSLRGFDAIKSRIFLNNLVLFIDGFKESISMPLTINGMSNDSSIMMSFELEINDEVNFDLGHTDISRSKLLKNLVENTSFFEVSIIKNSNKISFCAEWDKNLSMPSAFSFISLESINKKTEEIHFTPSYDTFIEGQIKELEESVTEVEEATKDEVSESESINSSDPDVIKEEVVNKIKESAKQDPFELGVLPDNYLEEEIQKVDHSLVKANSTKVESLKDEDEFISKISGTKNKDEFVQKISNSFEEGLKNELMKVKSTGSDKMSVDGLMRSIVNSAKDQGAFNGKSDKVIDSMSSEELIEKVLSLISQRGRQLDQDEIKKYEEREMVLKMNAYKFEREAKVLSLEVKKTEKMFESEVKKIQRSIESRDRMVKKTKETLQKVAAHKDKEIAELRRRLEEANKAKSSTASSSANDENKMEKHLVKKIESEKNTSRQLITELSKKKSEAKKLSSSVEALKATIKKQEYLISSLEKKTKTKKTSTTMSINEKRLDMSLKKAKEENAKLKKDSTRVKKEYMKLKNEFNTLKNTTKGHSGKKAS